MSDLEHIHRFLIVLFYLVVGEIKWLTPILGGKEELKNYLLKVG